MELSILFLALVSLFPATLQQGQIDLKLSLHIDSEALNQLGLDKSETSGDDKRIEKIMKHAIQGIRSPAQMVIAVVNLKRLRMATWQTYSKPTLAENLDATDRIKPPGRYFADFEQVWTGWKFPLPPVAAREDTVCGKKASSLISLVDENGKVFPDKVIAHLVLKALTINMGMNETTLPQGCRGECRSGCVTDSDSTLRKRYDTKMPSCAADFVRQKFKYQCIMTPVSEIYGWQAPICGNGIREGLESCDCRLGNYTCSNCCKYETCEFDLGAPACINGYRPTPSTKSTTRTTTTTTRRPWIPPAPPKTSSTTTSTTTTTTTTSTPKPSTKPQPKIPTSTKAPIPSPTKPPPPPTTSSTTTTTASTEQETTSTTAASVATSSATSANTANVTKAASHKSVLWIVLGLIALIVILIGVTVFIVFKKKGGKKQRRIRPSKLSTRLSAPASMPTAAVPFAVPAGAVIIKPIARRRSLDRRMR